MSGSFCRTSGSCSDHAGSPGELGTLPAIGTALQALAAAEQEHHEYGRGVERCSAAVRPRASCVAPKTRAHRRRPAGPGRPARCAWSGYWSPGPGYRRLLPAFGGRHRRPGVLARSPGSCRAPSQVRPSSLTSPPTHEPGATPSSRLVTDPVTLSGRGGKPARERCVPSAARRSPRRSAAVTVPRSLFVAKYH